eukprot:241383-Rhodomonas_salina.1
MVRAEREEEKGRDGARAERRRGLGRDDALTERGREGKQWGTCRERTRREGMECGEKGEGKR